MIMQSSIILSEDVSYSLELIIINFVIRSAIIQINKELAINFQTFQ